MSTQVLAQPEVTPSWRIQASALITLGIGAVALGLLFYQEVTAAVQVWISSTAYNHCFLIIPIAGYLIWDRRAQVRGMVAEPWPLAALGGLPLALAWLAAERLGIMEGRQLVAMSFLELLLLAVLGPLLWWQLAGPLLYLYFLVPFGDFLTTRLQNFTTAFVQHGLDLLQIPAYIDGFSIQIPEGNFYIAQACAGLRFLIASIAFGTLYALLMYRSPLRRGVFIGVSLIVPIIANGLRALGIVVLGHLLGSAQAAATDHVLYGWLFFSIVILLLIVLGLPFREDLARPGPPATRVPPRPSDRSLSWQAAALAATLVVVVAAISPAGALQLDRAGRPPAAPVQALQFGPACIGLPTGKAALPNAAGMIEPQASTGSRRIICDGSVYDVTLVVFSRHATAAPVIAMANRLGALPASRNDDDFVEQSEWVSVAPQAGRLWHLNHTIGPGPVRAVAIWVGGRPAAGGLAMRLHLALTSLTGAAIPPVVLGLRPEHDPTGAGPASSAAAAKRLAALLVRTDFTDQIRRLVAGQ